MRCHGIDFLIFAILAEASFILFLYTARRLVQKDSFSSRFCFLLRLIVPLQSIRIRGCWPFPDHAVR